MKIFQILTRKSFALQLLMKIYITRYNKEIVSLVDKIIDVYRQNSHSNVHKRYMLMNRFCNHTEMIFKLGSALYSLSVISYFLYPIYIYVLDREYMVLLPLYLPGVNEQSISGYTVLITFHIFLLIFGFVGSCASDFLFTMIIINARVMSNILRDNVNELNEILATKNYEKVTMKMKLKNIFLIHQEMTK